MTPILSVSGIGPHLVNKLAEKGISTAEQLATTSPAALIDISGIGVRRAESLLAAARLALESTPPKLSKGRKAPAQSATREAPQKAPVEAEPVAIAEKVETSTAPKKAAIKDDKDNKKVAAKKAAGKKVKTKKKATAKKAVAKKKAKEKAAAKKAAAKKRAAKKKVKASKSKKSGKPKKK